MCENEDITFYENIDEALSKYCDLIKSNFEFLNNQHQTDFDEVDTKRYETRQCIVFNLGISAMAMMGITLEECLKALLKHNYVFLNNDKNVVSKLNNLKKHSLEAEEKYGSKTLHKLIPLAFKENLITKIERDQLTEKNEFIRNAFIHSDKSKIFDQNTKTEINIYTENNNNLKFEENKSMGILGFLPAHGHAQAKLALKYSRNIFDEVDDLIITICDRFWNNLKDIKND